MLFYTLFLFSRQDLVGLSIPRHNINAMIDMANQFVRVCAFSIRLFQIIYRPYKRIVIIYIHTEERYIQMHEDFLSFF